MADRVPGQQDMGRDPTTVEMFDFGQSNSEHSRHWFFKGRIVIDGEEQEGDLMHHVTHTPQFRYIPPLLFFGMWRRSHAGAGSVCRLARRWTAHWPTTTT